MLLDAEDHVMALMLPGAARGRFRRDIEFLRTLLTQQWEPNGAAASRRIE